MWDRTCEPWGCSELRQDWCITQREVNDRGKRMVDRYLERMTLKVEPWSWWCLYLMICDHLKYLDSASLSWYTVHTHTHNHFRALFLGPPGWAGARRELLDFMVHAKINGGRHTDHLSCRHSIQTNQCLPPPSPIRKCPKRKQCHFIRSLVVDEERMRPGHWLGLVLCVAFSALTLLGYWEDIRPVKTCDTYPQSFCLEHVEEENQDSRG